RRWPKPSASRPARPTASGPMPGRSCTQKFTKNSCPDGVIRAILSQEAPEAAAPMNERTLFLQALEIADPARRDAFLDQECARDPALRQRIERLLAAHAAAGGILDK